MTDTPRVRLAIVITNAAALEVFLRKQIQYLQRHGFEIEVVTSPGKEIAAFEAATGIRVKVVPMERSIRPLADLVSLFRIWRALREIAPDMIHCHLPKAGVLGTIAGWAARVETRFFTFHGSRSDTLRGWRRLAVRSTDRLTSLFATHVLAVSPSLRESIVREGFCAESKISVIGHGSCCGVDLSVFDSSLHSRSAFRSRYGIPEDAFVLGFVGRIARDKGIGELDEAFAALRNRCSNLWLFLCGFEDSDDPVSDAVLQRLYSDGRVRKSAGFVQDTPAVYVGMDLLALPSYREGFGITAIEAAAMRLPVVATRIEGIIDAVQDGVTGTLVAPRDAEQLADAVESLVRDGGKYRSFASAARAMAETRFSADAVASGVRHAYEAALSEPRKSAYGSIVKPFLDAAAAFVLLLVFAPVLLAAAVAVRFTLGSPVLFRQQRGGRKRVPIEVLKLRTMNESRDAEGALLPDELRMTRLGRFLRRISIDELPQLWNVLKGEMSLVGPRPLLARYSDRYNAFEARRLEVRPGITGWAQVHGRNLCSWDEKFHLDVWYVDHQSLSLDLRILWMTLKRIVRPTGIETEQGSMPEFFGSVNQT